MQVRSIVFTLGLLAGLFLLIPGQSYAIYSSEAAWQLVVISSAPACSVYHYNMLEKYNDISENYLDLYQLQNKGYAPQCMTEQEYLSEYEKPLDLDLLILVYDRDLGRADLHSQNTGGIYIHQGDDLSRNHTIIFCDCPNFEYSDPVWILSHELSHFVLNYLGFDLDIAEENIHELDQKFDHCVEVSYDDTCSTVKTRMVTERGAWVVMAPYEPAIGKDVPTPSSDNASFDSFYQKEMAIEVTNWWIRGDITNENYLKSLQILSGIETDEGIKTIGILAEPQITVLTEPPTEHKLPQNNENYSKVSTHLISKSPFIEEEKQTLSNQEEEALILLVKSRTDSWSADSINDEELLKDLEYILNSPKIDLYQNSLEDNSLEEPIDKELESQNADEYENSISYFDHALAQEIDSQAAKIELLILKGSALNDLGQFEEAMTLFDAVLDIEPTNFEALNRKAFSLAQLGEFDEAMLYLRLSQMHS